MSDLGVTGTRKGLTAKQYSLAILTLPRLGNITVHHGDCVGVDAQIHAIALSQGYPIKIHPPDNDKHRAFCEGGEVVDPLPYHQRNRAIVNECDALFAFPSGPETRRSGTWSTIRYANALRVPITIVYPDGSTDDLNVG